MRPSQKQLQHRQRLERRSQAAVRCDCAKAYCVPHHELCLACIHLSQPLHFSKSFAEAKMDCKECFRMSQSSYSDQKVRIHHYAETGIWKSIHQLRTEASARRKSDRKQALSFLQSQPYPPPRRVPRHASVDPSFQAFQREIAAASAPAVPANQGDFSGVDIGSREEELRSLLLASLSPSYHSSVMKYSFQELEHLQAELGLETPTIPPSGGDDRVVHPAPGARTALARQHPRYGGTERLSSSSVHQTRSLPAASQHGGADLRSARVTSVPMPPSAAVGTLQQAAPAAAASAQRPSPLSVSVRHRSVPKQSVAASARTEGTRASLQARQPSSAAPTSPKKFQGSLALQRHKSAILRQVLSPGKVASVVSTPQTSEVPSDTAPVSSAPQAELEASSPAAGSPHRTSTPSPHGSQSPYVPDEFQPAGASPRSSEVPSEDEEELVSVHGESMSSDEAHDMIQAAHQRENPSSPQPAGDVEASASEEHQSEGGTSPPPDQDRVSAIIQRMDAARSVPPPASPHSSLASGLPPPGHLTHPSHRASADDIRRLREAQRLLDQEQRHSQKGDLFPEAPFKIPRHPVPEDDPAPELERQIGRRRVLHQEDDEDLQFGDSYQDQYFDPASPQHQGPSGDSLVPAMFDVLDKVASLAGQHIQGSTAPPPPMRIPEDELLPPRGFLMPGLSDQFVSEEYEKQWKLLYPGEPLPSQRPLRPGHPLEKLKIDISSDRRDEWMTMMERHASDIRDFMQLPPLRVLQGLSSSVPSAGVHWQVQPSEDTVEDQGINPPGLHEVGAQLEVMQPLGLPVPPESEALLQKVAYAPTFQAASGYAAAIRVPPKDFKRTLQWNTDFAAHEAAPLADPRQAGTSKEPQKIINDFLNNKPRHKARFSCLREQIKISRDTLKCNFAMSAAVEASNRATAMIEESVRSVKQSQQQLMDFLKKAGFLQGSFHEQTSLYQNMQTDLHQALSGVEALRSTNMYLQGAAQAGTDASARCVRTAVENYRTETLRSVFSIPDNKKDTPLETAVVKLPVTPSSLFGGRLQVAVNLLGSKSDRQKKFVRDANRYSGTSHLLGKRPFPGADTGDAEEVPAPPIPKKRKKKNKRSKSRADVSQATSQTSDDPKPPGYWRKVRRSQKANQKSGSGAGGTTKQSGGNKPGPKGGKKSQ